MHYRHNYLTRVILRLDYDAIAVLREMNRVDAKPPFSQRIADQFPVAAGKPTATLAVNIGPGGAGIQQQNTGVIWEYRRVDNGTQVVTLAPETLTLDYGKNDFDHFPPFRDHSRLAIDALLAEYHPDHFNRIGLRYINEVNFNEGNPLDWDGLLHPNLIVAANAGAAEGDQIVRSMHQTVLRNGDYTTAFNYGLLNPDFPNALARRLFVLDYDCSRMGPIPAAEALATLDAGNTICESLFERSIGIGLREKMEIINE